MTFEKWCEWVNRGYTEEDRKWLTTSGITCIARLLADWKAEREKWIGTLAEILIECSKWPNLGCSVPISDIVRIALAEVKEKGG